MRHLKQVCSLTGLLCYPSYRRARSTPFSSHLKRSRLQRGSRALNNVFFENLASTSSIPQVLVACDCTRKICPFCKPSGRIPLEKFFAISDHSEAYGQSDCDSKLMAMYKLHNCTSIASEFQTYSWKSGILRLGSTAMTPLYSRISLSQCHLFNM